MPTDASAGRRRGRPPSSAHSPSPAPRRRRGLHALSPRPPRGGVTSDGGRLRRGRPPGRGRGGSRGRARSILPPNFDLMPLPAEPLRPLSPVSPAAQTAVGSSSSLMPQSNVLPLPDLLDAETQRRREIWLGKRPVIDSASGTDAFCSLLFLLRILYPFLLRFLLLLI